MGQEGWVLMFLCCTCGLGWPWREVGQHVQALGNVIVFAEQLSTQKVHFAGHPFALRKLLSPTWEPPLR